MTKERKPRTRPRRNMKPRELYRVGKRVWQAAQRRTGRERAKVVKVSDGLVGVREGAVVTFTPKSREEGEELELELGEEGILRL